MNYKNNNKYHFMNKEIKFETIKGFNQSSKIIAYKLGLKASILLSNLIYKHNYWFDKNRLIKLEEEYYFFITYSNLEAETTIKNSGIKKAIKDLKDWGLIKVKRKGVPATNHYTINVEVLSRFESKYEEEYLKWIEGLSHESKKDRERFSQHIITENNEKFNKSKNVNNIEISQNELIEYLRR